MTEKNDKQTIKKKKKKNTKLLNPKH